MFLLGSGFLPRPLSLFLISAGPFNSFSGYHFAALDFGQRLFPLLSVTSFSLTL